MKVDLEYMSELLGVFQDSENAHIAFNDLTAADIGVIANDEVSQKFIFHMQLAIDNQLIGNKDGLVFNLKGIGLTQTLSGSSVICAVPIRLTQAGHDFASTLNNKEVLEKLKTEFKDAPFKIIFEGGQKLLQHFMKKKLETIME